MSITFYQKPHTGWSVIAEVSCLWTVLTLVILCAHLPSHMYSAPKVLSFLYNRMTYMLCTFKLQIITGLL